MLKRTAIGLSTFISEHKLQSEPPLIVSSSTSRNTSLIPPFSDVMNPIGGDPSSLDEIVPPRIGVATNFFYWWNWLRPGSTDVATEGEKGSPAFNCESENIVSQTTFHSLKSSVMVAISRRVRGAPIRKVFEYMGADFSSRRVNITLTNSRPTSWAWRRSWGWGVNRKRDHCQGGRYRFFHLQYIWDTCIGPQMEACWSQVRSRCKPAGVRKPPINGRQFSPTITASLWVYSARPFPAPHRINYIVGWFLGVGSVDVPRPGVGTRPRPYEWTAPPAPTVAPAEVRPQKQTVRIPPPPPRAA